MKNDNEESVSSEKSHKPRRSKSREVSSRFLNSNSTVNSSIENGISAPNQALSPTLRKSRPNSMELSRKIKSQEASELIQGLWPSSTTTISSSSSSPSSNKKLDTLADHLGNDRLKDLQKTVNSNEFSTRSLEPEREMSKENHKPLIGGSVRYTGKLNFSGKSVSSSSSFKMPTPNSESTRLSFDETTIYGKSRRKSDAFKDNMDLEGDCSFSTASSRKPSKEVSSKYLNDKPNEKPNEKPRRRSSDSSIPNPTSFDGSPKMSTTKNVMKRANSISSAYGSTISQWALSPGRSGEPPMSVENKEKPMSFSSLKPYGSTKGVEKLLSMGLDLFKSKKGSSVSSATPITLPVGAATSDSVHQLRILHNRLMQWRFVNAKSNVVNKNTSNLAESNLVNAWHGITKLQCSVVQKKLQLEKEKLEMKLNFILLSQLKLLEAWGDMERQHSNALSMTKKCLHSVVCRVPLVEGAKVDIQTISMAFRHASDLTASIKAMATTFSPLAVKTASLLSNVAKVVVQEKLLLEECVELHSIISTLEIEESSLKCGGIQRSVSEKKRHDYKDGTK